MSHRGSLLCLPDGIWAWPVDAPADDHGATPWRWSLPRAERLDFFLLGTGIAPWTMPETCGRGFAKRMFRSTR